MVDFRTAIDRVLGHEGGYVNDPKDPGGETKWGISKRSYPHLDVKNLTRDQAIEIYERDFWNRIHADELYDGIAYQGLDYAINSGIKQAILGFQQALGVPADGVWGPVTRAAALAMPEGPQIMRYVAQRIDFLRTRSTFSYFAAGGLVAWLGMKSGDNRAAAAQVKQAQAEKGAADVRAQAERDRAANAKADATVAQSAADAASARADIDSTMAAMSHDEVQNAVDKWRTRG